MRYDNEEWCKIWNRIDLPVQNWHKEFNKFWLKHSKILKFCTFMGSFWPNYIMFQLKKYRGVIFDGTQDWYKVWRKTDLCFQKWHEEFGKFSSDHLKLSKLEPWWDPFTQSWKCMSLKFTGELCVMTMIKDAKLKANWLVSSKLTWGIDEFWPEHSKILHFNELLSKMTWRIRQIFVYKLKK